MKAIFKKSLDLLSDGRESFCDLNMQKAESLAAVWSPPESPVVEGLLLIGALLTRAPLGFTEAYSSAQNWLTFLPLVCLFYTFLTLINIVHT